VACVLGAALFAARVRAFARYERPQRSHATEEVTEL